MTIPELILKLTEDERLVLAKRINEIVQDKIEKAYALGIEEGMRRARSSED